MSSRRLAPSAILSLFSLSAVSLAATSPASASAPVFEWSANVPNSVTADTRGEAMAIHADGSVAMIGRGTPSGAGSNIKVNKFAANGVSAWSREINGSGNNFDSGLSLAFFADGALAVCGHVSLSPSDYAMVTAKYDVNGDLLWLRERANPRGNAYGQSLRIGSDSSVVVSGIAQNHDGLDEVLVVKYAANGDFKWERRIAAAGTGFEWSFGLELDSAGNVTVLGDASSGSLLTIAVRYNAEGAVQWTLPLPIQGGIGASAMTTDVDGSLIVVQPEVIGDFESAPRLTRIEPSGQVAWIRTLTPPSGASDSGFSLALTTQGQIAIAGTTRSETISGSENFLTLLVDRDGNLLWRRVNGIAPPSDDIVWSLAPGKNGAVIAVGTTAEDSSAADAWAMEYSASGALNWVRQFDDGAGESAFDVKVDSAGSIYVGGTREVNSTTKSQFLVKYRDDQLFLAGFDN